MRVYESFVFLIKNYLCFVSFGIVSEKNEDEIGRFDKSHYVFFKLN